MDSEKRWDCYRFGKSFSSWKPIGRSKGTRQLVQREGLGASKGRQRRLKGMTGFWRNRLRELAISFQFSPKLNLSRPFPDQKMQPTRVPRSRDCDAFFACLLHDHSNVQRSRLRVDGNEQTGSRRGIVKNRAAPDRVNWNHPSHPGAIRLISVPPFLPTHASTEAAPSSQRSTLRSTAGRPRSTARDIDHRSAFRQVLL